MICVRERVFTWAVGFFAVVWDFVLCIQDSDALTQMNEWTDG